MARGWLYDGQSAVRRDVTVRSEGRSGIRVEVDPGGAESVPREKLIFVENRRGHDVYGRSDRPGWRLGLDSAAAAELAALLPRKERYGRLIDRVGLVPAVVAAALLSAAVVLLGMSFPSLAAPYVPRSVEKRFGDTLVGDFGGRFCAGPGGEAALHRLAARLSPRSGELNIRVVKTRIVNAAAFPGGHIVIFDQLLREADGPDEFAGVLAHEIAHVEERHTTESMIRELGLGMFVAALGGSTGANAETLLAARYSRDSEAEADDVAIAALLRARISPAGTAKFFERVARDEAKLGRARVPLSYIASHPMSEERRKKFAGAAAKGSGYRPSLTPGEWEALRDICSNDPRSPKGELDFLF